MGSHYGIYGPGMGTMKPEWKPWDQGMGGTMKAIVGSIGARNKNGHSLYRNYGNEEPQQAVHIQGSWGLVRIGHRRGIKRSRKGSQTDNEGARIRPHLRQGRGQRAGIRTSIREPKKEQVITTTSILNNKAEPRRAPSCRGLRRSNLPELLRQWIHITTGLV